MLDECDNQGIRLVSCHVLYPLSAIRFCIQQTLCCVEICIFACIICLGTRCFVVDNRGTCKMDDRKLSTVILRGPYGGR